MLGALLLVALTFVVTTTSAAHLNHQFHSHDSDLTKTNAFHHTQHLHPHPQQQQQQQQQQQLPAPTRLLKHSFVGSSVPQAPIASPQPQQLAAASSRQQLSVELEPQSPQSSTLASASTTPQAFDASDATQPTTQPPPPLSSSAAGVDEANHETVYSDQRFASLFARRNNARKVRLSPAEPIKAKPTLPSFIKSTPDPRQVAAAAVAEASSVQQSSLGAQTVASSLGSARQSAQGSRSSSSSGRLGSAGSGLTSGTGTSTGNGNASSAANKLKLQISTTRRPVSAKLQQQQVQSQAGSRASASSASASTSASLEQASAKIIKPQTLPQTPGDQMSVIAAARKRLLASNALESAKLKQQQKLQQSVAQQA